MATSNPAQAPTFYTWDDSDDASAISVETDDGQDHLPEKILAESELINGNIWYLVKWEDCSVLRSSWEDRNIFYRAPRLWEDWKEEQERQKEGKTKPLDIEAWDRAVQQLEEAERDRRRLRRLKRKIKRVLSIVSG